MILTQRSAAAHVTAEQRALELSQRSLFHCETVQCVTQIVHTTRQRLDKNTSMAIEEEHQCRQRWIARIRRCSPAQLAGEQETSGVKHGI